MLIFKDVAIRYGNGTEILHDVNFHLEPGSFQLLTGPSGAGKTSLLKLMYLARRPSRGQITMFGHNLADLPRSRLPEFRRRIGVVFQNFRLLDHLSAFDNVALPLRISGIDEADYREDVEELLTWVGLGDHLDAKPATLSGGEQQRIAIARAVVGKPELLLADEPTGNVDTQIGQRLMRLFVELNKLGTSILIATHDDSQAETLPVQVLNLRDGTLSSSPSKQS